ncbi:MAG: methylenetetrahydrofolate reductase C-terminal domain-containing protein [Desulfohalobiaceae bacterium]|nr:methylenetetrahydrofolate reductase C-terminal domain-containing protein [Desulfohalobiaceae bacterium]
MIVAKEKKFDDILAMVKEYDRILVLGCGTCTAVCHSGGEKEAEDLAFRLQGKLSLISPDKEVRAANIERQCEIDFLREFLTQAEWADVVISLACGAGVQSLVQILEDKPVFPGTDTTFIGSYTGEGTWTEMCRACGECILHLTGGICPVTRCAKKLLNGPCGGTSSYGYCEVGQGKPCAWHQIIQRLEALNKLHLYEDIAPLKRWAPDPTDNGPRKRIFPGVGQHWK